ncbi:MAG: hypothetical protein WAV38_16925 [Xanthobacteraceae bacterium]
MAIDIRRRQFISALGLAAVIWPRVARAQKAPLPVVGLVDGAKSPRWSRTWKAGARAGGSDIV